MQERTPKTEARQAPDQADAACLPLYLREPATSTPAKYPLPRHPAQEYAFPLATDSGGPQWSIV